MEFHDDTTSFLCGLATGVALGALAMFIFDPEQGRREIGGPERRRLALLDLQQEHAGVVPVQGQVAPPQHPGVANPEGVRARVGGVHLPLDVFLSAFLGPGLRMERFEELGDREYPHVVALRARR